MIREDGYFGVGGRPLLRATIRQNSRKKPIVRSRCTYPGASVVRVTTAQAMSITTAAMSPASMMISLTVSLLPRKL
jgi:hypothetical protein